jgi:uncharacterized 2Fe-2S/4Fe-4S cluster protein (DUF4445 family)
MTTTHTIKFLPHNREIKVNDGESLIRAAMEAGVHINASCGGEGVCGKCRVIVETGAVDGGLSEQLSPADREKGFRLACRSTITQDVVVRVPVESAIDASVLSQRTVPRRTARIRQMDLNDLKEQGLFLPPVEKVYIELPEPNSQDHLPDVTRLVSHLKLHHDEHRLTVSLPVIRKIPDALRKDGFRVTATLARPVMESGKTEIINVQPGDTTERNYAIALDIGTTTIYGQLIDLKSGDVLAERGDFNGQISYGEDVISRIVLAEKEGGLERLHEVVTETINTIINRIVRRAKVDPDDIAAITLAGNTTMTQLLLQVNPRYIRRSPYVPASTLYPPIRAVDIGLDLRDHVTALVYPAVSSYVGGDIVAGVMGSGMYLDDRLTLFMDIGTNAEIVIGNRDWLACAACSAGPAFEGGGIKFGMRAAKGRHRRFFPGSGIMGAHADDHRQCPPQGHLRVRVDHHDRRHVRAGPDQQPGQVQPGAIDQPHPRRQRGVGIRAGLGRRDPDRPGHRHNRNRHRKPDPGQGSHFQRLHDTVDRGGHGHAGHRPHHPGRWFRQLRGSGKGHDHRSAAGNRPG